MLRLIVYILFFLVSIGAIVRGLSRSQRPQAMLQLACLIGGGTLAGILLGMLIGWATAVEHAAIWCGVGFGLAGGFSGLAAWLFHMDRLRTAVERESVRMPMSKFTLAAISGGSIAGALLGTWLAVVVEMDEGLFWCPVGMLLGATVGAYAGIIYEKPRAGLGLLAFLVVGGGLSFLLIGKLDRAERAARQERLGPAVPAPPPPNMFDQMYDREELLASLARDEAESAFSSLTSLWLLSDGGPRFYLDGNEDGGVTLRHTLKYNTEFGGRWLGEVFHLGDVYELEFEFPEAGEDAASAQEFVFRVRRADGETVEATGQFERHGDSVNLKMGPTSFSLMR